MATLFQPSLSSGNSTRSGNNGTNHASPLPAPPQKHLPESKNSEKMWLHFRLNAIFLAKAYGGSLLLTSIGFPIFASVVTVSFYLAPSITLPILYLEHVDPSWYALVYGFLTSCLALLLFAAFRIHFATARGAKMDVYKLLKNCHSELKARLRIIDISNHVHTNDELDGYYRMEALRKAYEAYHDLTQSLFHNRSSIEWAFGTGYTSAWRLIHRAQEALIGVETDQEVISEVIHDVRSIQNLAFNDSTALIRKMLQAVKDISPDAMAYFEELRAVKNYADLFDPPHQRASVMKLLVDFFQKNKSMQQASANQMAREAIRQVKHTLNLYQDHLRETLVRLRNHVLISIAVTGFVTYLLVCNIILWHAPKLAISTATAYYLIGVIGGLFVRFYNESNNKDSPEDYGLFVSRLIATPLLSGLAGIGGVLVTATVSTVGSSGTALSWHTLFTYPPNLDYLIAATIFGSAPNLIIGTLQQRAQRYTTELQNSKGEGTSKDE